MRGKVAIFTLGCKLNFSESSTIARQFETGGYTRVKTAIEADICVVNTCSVTEHADKKCRNLIRKIHRQNPVAIIAVTGCYAQLKAAEIATIEGVDLVLSNNDKGALYERVVGLTGKGNTEITNCSTAELTNFFAAFSSADRTRSFLKVQDGCDYKCSYCTIHAARGASRNIPISDIVTEARYIASRGICEVVITGVNTGDFGHTTGEKFIDLLRALDKVEGIERYRISSIEPNLLTDEIINFCATSYKFQPHFHIPLQSGSDRILGLMRRRYTTAKFADRISSVRDKMPDAFIGIDVIVGFPSETDEDFETTFSFLEQLRPSYIHVFPFSERAGTDAAIMPDKVKDSIKTERAARLGALCQELEAEFYKRFAGKESEVLWESTIRGGQMTGYTGNYLKITAPYEPGKIGTIEKITIPFISDFKV